MRRGYSWLSFKTKASFFFAARGAAQRKSSANNRLGAVRRNRPLERLQVSRPARRAKYTLPPIPSTSGRAPDNRRHHLQVTGHEYRSRRLFATAAGR